MFILVIIAVIFVIVLYLIKQEGTKHQASELNIKDRKQSDFVDAINDVTTEITKKEYSVTGRQVYRDGGMKAKDIFYTADFTANAKKKFNELMNKTSWSDGGFHPEFVVYVEYFYADATMSNFKDILEEYIMEPKPLPKKQRMQIQQLIKDAAREKSENEIKTNMTNNISLHTKSSAKKETETEVSTTVPMEEIVDEIEEFDDVSNTANSSQSSGLQKVTVEEKTTATGGKTLGNGPVDMNQKVLSNKPSRIVPIRQDVKTTMKAPPIDKCMLHAKFVRLGDLNKFEKSFAEFFGFSELSGIFVCYNASKRKWYVGQGQRALQKLLQIFRSPNSSVPDLKKDWDAGDTVFVNFVRLKDTDYNTLDELEYEYIEKYDCLIPKGYNRSHGRRIY